MSIVGGVCLILFLAFLGFQDFQRLGIVPFDFGDQNNANTYIKHLSQIEASGGLLYIREPTNPIIVVIDSKGDYVRTIGKAGEGPEELGASSQSFGVDGPSLWTMNGNMKFAHYYENGEHAHRIRIENYNRFINATDASLPIAFSRDSVIIPPLYRVDRSMAYVYGYDGEIKYKVPAPFNSEKELRKNPAVNETFWFREGDIWYCLFKHKPLLYVYDKTFRLQNQFELEGPEIADHAEALKDFERKKRWDIPPPYFTDAKVFKGKVYALCKGALYQIDPKQGLVLQHTTFFLKIPEIDEYDLSEDVNVQLFYFALLENGTLVLGHPALMWGHDLWKVKLPYKL